ncbi:class I SAM-dependent methyltransferase [Bacteriovoracaceae bacterium]|nr:class I SAM-dependent methyltransferase [Bacteriovoracaceae bacterium]
MKYYELHDEFWKELKNQGYISWDKESKNEILDRERNNSLLGFLEDGKGGKALDLGSGSGSQSFFLSTIGYECVAVDISSTAIEIGMTLAQELNYNIEFKCLDICSLNLEITFDLITDSCLLHCLVYEEDRVNFFQTTQRHLKRDGRVFIYTMIRDEDENYFTHQDYLLLDDEGILWSLGPKRYDVEWKLIQGQNYFAHRRIQTLDQQRQEILFHRFSIIQDRVIHTSNDEPDIYTAWLQFPS